MSSYNENLHSGVVSSLSAQELDLQNVEAKLEASMFSLYYAQGARITTAEDLEITTAKYAYEKKVHEQAIIDSDLSTNVLQSANNAKDYTAKSVTNTSVAAANVQIAANAILKLASDAGSIFSIVNAADYDTDIYAQSNKAYVLMNDTAYDAEQASQHSMEASAAIAEVTTNTLADKATVTDTSIKDLLGVLTQQFNDTTTLLATQSAELADANTKEKAAEGELEDYSVSYNATLEAYNLNNSELNLNLEVTTPINIGNHDTYTVSFNNYKSAFNLQAPDGGSFPLGYPVQNYYIMLVENSKSSTFSTNDAEGLITEGYANRYITITPSDDNKDGIVQQIAIKKSEDKDQNSIPYLQDSEGKDLTKGKEYVIFVLTVFTMQYKKSINNFDDYLSAPSMMFSLKNQLNSVDSGGIVPPDANNVIQFGVFENPAYLQVAGKEMLNNIEYRCVFLPNNKELVRGLLTDEELKYIDEEVKDREQLTKLYDTKIKEVQAKIEALKGTNTTNQTQAKVAKETAKAGSKKTSKSNSSGISDAQREKLLNNQLTVLKKQKAAVIANEAHIQPGFFFNLTISQDIPAGSYTDASEGTMTLLAYLMRQANEVWDKLGDDKAKKLNSDITNYSKKKSGPNVDVEQFMQDIINMIESVIQEVVKKSLENLLADFGQLIRDLILLSRGYKFYPKQVTLAPETTDNFGNRLINLNSYIPAVISISNNPDESINTQFTNALSDFQHTDAFKYQDPYAKSGVAYPKQTSINQS
ncbi:MAG: hypothetical protein AAF617_02350 [Bacteroidota bacterium]